MNYRRNIQGTLFQDHWYRARGFPSNVEASLTDAFSLRCVHINFGSVPDHADGRGIFEMHRATTQFKILLLPQEAGGLGSGWDILQTAITQPQKFASLAQLHRIAATPKTQNLNSIQFGFLGPMLCFGWWNGGRPKWHHSLPMVPLRQHQLRLQNKILCACLPFGRKHTTTVYWS